MALQLYALRIIQPHLKGASVLSLAYPDILLKPEQMQEKFGYTPLQSTDGGEYHGRHHRLPETVEFFTHMGATLRCVDVARLNGCEDIADLNVPQDVGQYDLVINPGTLEHCFNIGVAMMNASNAVKPGGYIYHEMPMGMLNHGFYNICPTMLYDFYTQNDWRIEVFMAANIKSALHITPNFATKRHAMQGESLIICFAKRNSDAPLRWPIQAKYLDKLGGIK